MKLIIIGTLVCLMGIGNIDAAQKEYDNFGTAKKNFSDQINDLYREIKTFKLKNLFTPYLKDEDRKKISENIESLQTEIAKLKEEADITLVNASPDIDPKIENLKSRIKDNLKSFKTTVDENYNEYRNYKKFISSLNNQVSQEIDKSRVEIGKFLESERKQIEGRFIDSFIFKEKGGIEETKLIEEIKAKFQIDALNIFKNINLDGNILNLKSKLISIIGNFKLDLEERNESFSRYLKENVKKFDNIEKMILKLTLSILILKQLGLKKSGLIKFIKKQREKIITNNLNNQNDLNRVKEEIEGEINLIIKDLDDGELIGKMRELWPFNPNNETNEGDNITNIFKPFLTISNDSNDNTMFQLN